MVLDCFDQAFLVNRDQDTERFSRVSKRLEQVGIDFERFPAVVPEEPGKWQTIGIRGNFDSHREIVREAIRRKLSSVLIIEDDAIIKDNFVEAWNSVKARLGEIDWDLFYFYDWKPGPEIEAREKLPLSLIKINDTCCVHFYAVSSRCYERVLEIASANEGQWYDVVLSESPLKKWATSHNLAGQEANKSLLNGCVHGDKWYA